MTDTWGGRMGFGGQRLGEFPNPFLDVASRTIPTNHATALKFMEYIYNANETYRSAMERVNSYFITEIDVGGNLGQDEKDKWETYFREDLDVLHFLWELSGDRSAYGNGFASVIVPFRRFLVCKKKGCGLQVRLDKVYNDPQFNFRFTDFWFHAKCPKCGYQGEWEVNDQQDEDEKKIILKRWSVHEIHLVHDIYTDQTAYLWRIPEAYRQDVRKGTLHTLERVDLEVLKAVKNNWLYRFFPDQVFHMKCPTIGGFRTRGWGVSPTLLNYRQIYYVACLRRFNEAIAQDWILPFRLITPAPRPGAADPQMGDLLMTQDAGDFMSSIRRIVRMHRLDPSMWHTSPFPVQYQTLGGEGKNLAPVDLMNQGLDTLLNGAQVPVDLYKGSLQIQAAPVAIRLFESMHKPLIHDLNFFLRWLMRQLSQVLSWERGTAVLRRPTYADDIQRQMLLIQLAASQDISKTRAFQNLGIAYKDEQRMVEEEIKNQQETQARMQEEAEQSAFGQQIAQGQMPGQAPPGGAPAQGGAPPAGGGAAPADASGMPGGIAIPDLNTPMSADELLQTAQGIAAQLLDPAIPSSVRNSQLRMLKQKNEFVHSQVIAEMEKSRNQAALAGRDQVLASQYGAGG